MIGHEKIRTFLENPNAYYGVMLFTGPASVGKWTMAEHLARLWQLREDHVLRFRNISMDDVRVIAHLLHYYESGRLFILQIDSASSEAESALLKSLENVPPFTRVILISSRDQVSDTIRSRCQVFNFSLLTDEEVEAVLLSKNYGAAKAKKLATQSGGQVRNALSRDEDNEIRITVLAALRAIAEKDEEALEALSSRWTAPHTLMFHNLALEALTRRWRYFSLAEVEGYSASLLYRILLAMANSQEIRPRLFVRFNLMNLLRSDNV